MASVEELLVNSLEDLGKGDLKKFQWHLKKDHECILKSVMEKTDVLKTVDKMVDCFGPEETVKITVKILRKMNQNNLAEQLESKHKTVSLCDIKQRPERNNSDTHTTGVDHCGEFRMTAGLHKYACDLTLDPNTAHTRLILSDENRTVTCVYERQPYPDHPERFDVPQVLCGESLTGRCYWEAEWSGDADISVTYKGMSRKGVRDCVFGWNDKSWSLSCYNNRFFVRHNKNYTDIPVVSSSSKRVGVYVDVSAGTLSFYSVSDTHTLTHLHTLNTTFTEPLYAGFRLYSNSSVSLCDIKQRPERNNSDTHTTGFSQPKPSGLDEDFLIGESDPSLKDAVKVLTVKDEGITTEPVQLTRFHAKILQPSFSLKTLIISWIMRLYEHCDLLLYMRSKDPLLLHLYLFPFDDHAKEKIEKKEKSSYPVLHPWPDRPFRMKKPHMLDVPGAFTINPEEGITFRRETPPNFFSVNTSLENDLQMTLIREEDQETVWTTTIKKNVFDQIHPKRDEPRLNSDQIHPKRDEPCLTTDADKARYFKNYRSDLIQRVTNAKIIADKLRDQELIHDEQYSEITQSLTSQESMRKICEIIHKHGDTAEAEFISILQEEKLYHFRSLV